MINLASALKRDPENVGNLRFKYTQDMTATPSNPHPQGYGPITRILLVNDEGVKTFDQTLSTPGSSVSLKMWIQVGTEASDGTVNFPLVATTDPTFTNPDFLLTNEGSNSFQFWYGRHPDDKFSAPEKHYKKNRPHWRYEVKEKKTGGPNGELFRVGRVEITANSSTHIAAEDQAGLGFRVIIELQDAPFTPPVPRP